jgi:SWI/SNF-related matrix-associated actin-dependent regulator of chromatin subfamily A member 5
MDTMASSSSAAGVDSSSSAAAGASSGAPLTAAEKKEAARVRKLKAEQKKVLDAVREKQNAAVVENQDKMAKSRLDFLLQQSDIFTHFMHGSAPPVAATGDVGSPVKRGRKTEAEEDAELLQANEDAANRLEVQPHCVVDQAGKGRRMRSYQMEGLNWLIKLYDNAINGILADEMGLGKTLQTISLLGYLKESRGVNGPHMVVVPKSTLGNWVNEFANWCPSLRVLRFHGSKEERRKFVEEQLIPGTFDVLVTTYEVAILEKAAMSKFNWCYLIIDEAHRIKNEDSVLSTVVRFYSSQYRLLITGTPLQNNLHELWALLNFLLPEVFKSSEDFDTWFDLSDENTQGVVDRLHKVLRPFLLRRLKSEVAKDLPPKREIKLYVGLSPMQTEWYRKLLLKDLATVNTAAAAAPAPSAAEEEGEGEEGAKRPKKRAASAAPKVPKVRLLNIAMQLRKCCNHPYLFDGAELRDPSTGEYTNDEHIVLNSGKLMVLDKLLAKLAERGSRVLIFSQMTRVLDILEDYMFLRQHRYCRIDGNTPGEEREDQIDAFNADGSDIFCFLLSTRAGGLGINLATADTVVLYDSDWNPQMDLQAQDRAHRIGQKKPVVVYRFVSEGTIEEKVIERAEAKLHLDAMVVQQGRLQEQYKGVGKDELLAMIRFGADEIFRSKGGTVTDEDIDAIIARGQGKTEELAAKMKEKFQETNLNLSTFSVADADASRQTSLFEFRGDDYRDLQKQHQSALAGWIEPPKRERKATYNIDAYYRNAMKAEVDRKPRAIRPPKQRAISDFQFYPPRLAELFAEETRRYKGRQAWAAKIEKSGRRVDDVVEGGEPGPLGELNEEERAERDELLKQGFSNWKYLDYRAFVRGSERYGRTAYSSIAAQVSTKTEAEVREYAKVFWARFKELKDAERVKNQVEKGEARLQRATEMRDALRRKCASVDNPWRELSVSYGHNKGKQFIEDEDRFLLCMANEVGFGNWEALRQEVRRSWQLRFDWFLKSRSATELGRRVESLVRIIEKDQADEDAAAGKSKKKGSESSAAVNAAVAATGKRKKRASDDEDIVCEVCRSDERDEKLILCDGDCGTGFHTFCLPSPMPHVPSGKWYCATCTKERESQAQESQMMSAPPESSAMKA